MLKWVSIFLSTVSQNSLVTRKSPHEGDCRYESSSTGWWFNCTRIKDVRVQLCVFPCPSFVTEKWGHEIHANDAIKKKGQTPITLTLNHISTEVFLCVFGAIIFPSPRGLLGKFLYTHKSCREGGTQMLSDKQGHTGSWLCACLIVLEALICQGSAGNQVGL